MHRRGIHKGELPTKVENGVVEVLEAVARDGLAVGQGFGVDGVEGVAGAVAGGAVEDVEVAA